MLPSITFQIIFLINLHQLKFNSINFDSRILHGHESEYNEFPFYAGLCFINPSKGRGCVSCGGALLNNQWILTAGHCIKGRPEDTTAYLGLNQYSWDYTKDETPIRMSKFYIHEKYQSNPEPTYDIALVKLKEPVEFSEKIQPIQLLPNPLPSGVVITVIGRGDTYNTTKAPYLSLMVVDLAVLSNQKCHDTSPNFNPEQMFCALGQNYKSSCDGDSGGPALINTGDQMLHVGIMSSGSFNCNTGTPEFYTRTSHFIDWIDNIILNDSN